MKETQEINLLDLETAKKEFKYGQAHALAVKNYDQKHNLLFITGKITVFGMNSLKDLETLDVVFPVNLTMIKHQMLNKHLEKCDLRLKSVSIPELSLNNLSDVNRIAENLYILAMRCRCNITMGVFKALLQEPKFYKHYASKIARTFAPSKLITALRYPDISPDKKQLFIKIKKHKTGDNIIYTGVHVYKINNVLISKDEYNNLTKNKQCKL